MTPEEALTRIGESTVAAVAAALEAYCPGAVTTHPPAIIEGEEDPVAGIEVPAVVVDVSYVGGVTGGNLFLMPLPAARALAAAMGGDEAATAGADADAPAELTELELSAAGEATNQMMAAAAVATTAILGQEVEIAAPETRVITSAGDALAPKDPATSVVSVAIDLLGHSCRLVQLIPHAFVVRMTRALDDLEADQPAAGEDGGPHSSHGTAVMPSDLLDGVGVRVAAELGRVSMTIRRAVSLAPGAVVELDRELEDPIDLYVNGRRFATGRLVTLEGDEWAVSIDTVAFDVTPGQGD